jgi:hypothetical protein
MYQSIQGPTDPMLRSNQIEGYSQVSRIGETVQNAFVEANEYGILPATFTEIEMNGQAYKSNEDNKIVGLDGVQVTDFNVVENKPHFFEWATATVGMISVHRRMRTAVRGGIGSDSAVPVVVCAAMRGPLDEHDWQFAGVVRSNSVRTMDDGVGPTTDEFFTVSIGGMVTILNNSTSVIHPGDYLSWTFVSDGSTGTKRATHGAPRRIGIRIADFHDDNTFAVAKGFAKQGQMFDALLS